MAFLTSEHQKALLDDINNVKEKCELFIKHKRPQYGIPSAINLKESKGPTGPLKDIIQEINTILVNLLGQVLDQSTQDERVELANDIGKLRGCYYKKLKEPIASLEILLNVYDTILPVINTTESKINNCDIHGYKEAEESAAGQNMQQPH